MTRIVAARSLRWLASGVLFAGCVRGNWPLVPLQDGGATDGGATREVLSDGTAEAVDGVPGADPIVVSSLRAEWTTPEVIHWRWDVEGDGTNFERYELIIATKRDDVLSRSQTATIWGAANNPELGHFVLPDTSGPDPVILTSSFGHAPDTEYFAQLVAIEASGRQSATLVVRTKTQSAPQHEIVVFSDTDTAGYSIPSEVVLSEEAPFAGTAHYQYTCPDGTCFETLRRQDVAISLDATPQSAFQRAFVEYALAIDGDHPSYWCQLRLSFGSGTDHSRLFGFVRWSMPAGVGYRLHQVPLRVLQDRFDGLTAGARLSYVELERGLFEFGVGCTWGDGHLARLDEIRIRW